MVTVITIKDKNLSNLLIKLKIIFSARKYEDILKRIIDILMKKYSVTSYDDLLKILKEEYGKKETMLFIDYESLREYIKKELKKGTKISDIIETIKSMYSNVNIPPHFYEKLLNEFPFLDGLFIYDGRFYKIIK